MADIRVLIVDDHALFREGVRALLNTYPDLEVVGEAGDGLEAIEKARELSPDVVLMDIGMPGLGGLEATLEIRKIRPESKVLVLTQHDNREYIVRFLKAGAAGYILKKAAGTELVSAIRLAHKGGVYLQSALSPEALAQSLEKEAQEPPAYERLSDREKQVLKLVAEGRTSREIAELLNLSVKTVVGHRTNIMEKLGLHNRAELIKYALKQGIISLQSDT